MAKFSAIHLDDVAALPSYGAAIEARGVRWSKRLSPDGYALFLVVSELDDGACLRWGRGHGDEAVYVLEGALDVDGAHRCPRTGAVIIESGVACEARAVGHAVIAHYGPTHAGEPSGRCVHVLGERARFVSSVQSSYEMRWFADSTCPTCRLAMFHVRSFAGETKGMAHHHTQDEIIYVIEGEMRMGARVLAPGTALSIPANLRYAVTSGPDGCAFINYRPGLSTMHRADGSEPVLETAGANGVETADFR